MEKQMKVRKRYTISVGFNDKDEKVQKVQTEKIVRLVENCCKGYNLPFSCSVQDGGYIPRDGGYILEKSVVIVLIDPCDVLVDELCGDLCAFLNQEAVMVTVEDVQCYYVSNSLK